MKNDSPQCSISQFPVAELDPIKKHFQLLASLPATTRSALLQHVTKVMEDQGAVSSLESVVCGNRASCCCRKHGNIILPLALSPPFGQLEQMCQKQKPSLAEATTAAVQNENIQSIVGLLEPWSQAEEAASPLKALHLLAGAMDGEEVVLGIDTDHIPEAKEHLICVL